MKRHLLLAAALSLGGCGLPGAIRAPAQAAAHTAADEEALKRCELTYKLSRTVMEIGVDANFIRGARAVQAAKLDNELYGALNVCRTAYRLFSSAELSRAADDMEAKSNEVTTLSKPGVE